MAGRGSRALVDIGTFARYAVGLGTFLKRPLTPAECRQAVERRLRIREAAFLRVLERAMFGNARSPYRTLLNHARITLEDVRTSVRKDGIEATLARLHDEGVYVTLDQFKGRRPIERRGLSIPVEPNDFDNPLLATHFEASTGGSRGAGRRILIDFGLLAHDAVYHSIFLAAFGLADRPAGVWHPVPPAVAGFSQVLRAAKVGAPPERWFTQTELAVGEGRLKHYVFTRYSVYGSRLLRRPLPAPEYVPLEDAGRIADWLAAKKEKGVPALLGTTPSSGVRACLAARERGLDISGTFFNFSSEPYTSAKAKIVAEAGCRGAPQYSMAEIGNIAMPCAAPAALDDVHLLKDKVAVIQRERTVGSSGMRVGALFYTTLLPSSPKLMLNAESDDYGVLGERGCGCLFGEVGFPLHLHTIRSYDKLTSEGMSFFGSELYSLVEEVLPARFGGHPTDYQFVEMEEGGLTKISLIVSPRVGDVDASRLIGTVLEALRSYSRAHAMMTDLLRRADALTVVRREPHRTGAAKILPLHISAAAPDGAVRDPHGPPDGSRA